MAIQGFFLLICSNGCILSPLDSKPLWAKPVDGGVCWNTTNEEDNFGLKRCGGTLKEMDRAHFLSRIPEASPSILKSYVLKLASIYCLTKDGSFHPISETVMIRTTPFNDWYEINISDGLSTRGSSLHFKEELPEESIIWKLAAMAFAL